MPLNLFLIPDLERWHTASFVELVVILVVKGLPVVVAAVEVVVVLLVLVDGGVHHSVAVQVTIPRPRLPRAPRRLRLANHPGQPPH